MEKIQHFKDLENLGQEISTTHQLISSAEIKSKEVAAKDEYDRSVGIFERFKMYGFYEKYNASSLPVREEVMNRLPAMISISPEIAFFSWGRQSKLPIFSSQCRK